MARGKTESRSVIINNKPATTVTKTFEQIVVNGNLTAEDKDINPGVDSRYA